MIDSDDVLLLRPARPGSGFQPVSRPDRPGERGLVLAITYWLRGPARDELVELVDAELRRRLGEMGVQLLATLVTEPSENNFPRLPVRSGEHVLAWFALLPDRQSLAFVERELECWPEWQREVHVLPSQRLRLEPARRSAIRWTGRD